MGGRHRKGCAVVALALAGVAAMGMGVVGYGVTEVLARIV